MPKRLKAKHNPFLAANVVGGVEFVIGAENTNVINIAIQLTDANYVDIGVAACVQFYISSDADGQVIHGTAVDTIAIGTDGLYRQMTAGLSGWLTSEEDGDIDINLTQDAATTYYLNIVLPDGSIVTSGAIVFA